jgi:pimeloyl-ACP methyl ester carboxylesterase
MENVTLAAGEGSITGLLSEGDAGRPLLVCIPGGSYNARYFDVDGHSFRAAAAQRGFGVAALNRPGYEDSTPLIPPTFAGNAEAISSAIDDLWARVGEGCPGVVLVGHSMGGAIAVHVASSPRSWPLLGIAISAIHDDAPEQVKQAWNSMPADLSIEFNDEQRIQFMYGPEGTYDPAVVRAAAPGCSPIPVAELLEVVDGWISDFPKIAADVDVPVHYALAEHEQLWNSSQSNVEAFAAAFTAAPRVSAHYVLGSGHNIDHHYVGADFRDGLLDWAQATSDGS